MWDFVVTDFDYIFPLFFVSPLLCNLKKRDMENILLVNKDDLREILSEIISQMNLCETVKDEVLSAAELRGKLGISHSTLWRWEKCGLLKPQRIGRKKFFSVNEVQLAMRGGK